MNFLAGIILIAKLRIYYLSICHDLWSLCSDLSFLAAAVYYISSESCPIYAQPSPQTNKPREYLHSSVSPSCAPLYSLVICSTNFNHFSRFAFLVQQACHFFRHNTEHTPRQKDWLNLGFIGVIILLWITAL